MAYWRNVVDTDLSSQNRCSGWETNYDLLPIRSTVGGPPAAANTFSSSVTNRLAGDRPPRCSVARPRYFVGHRGDLDHLAIVVESNWKSIAHTMFGASIWLSRAQISVVHCPAEPPFEPSPVADTAWSARGHVSVPAKRRRIQR